MAVREIDIVFVEDGAPLEGRSVQLLTRVAVAVFCVQWFFTAQLILDLSTVTTCRVADVEIWVVFVHLVGRSVFPAVQLAVHVWVLAVALMVIVSCTSFSRACGHVCRSNGGVKPMGLQK